MLNRFLIFDVFVCLCSFMSLCFNCLMIWGVFFFVADDLRIRSAMVELTFVVVCCVFFRFVFCLRFKCLFVFVYATCCFLLFLAFDRSFEDSACEV